MWTPCSPNDPLAKKFRNESKAHNCIPVLRATYAVLQVVLFLNVVAVLLFTRAKEMRQTWLLLLEGARQVMAASLSLGLFFSKASLSFTGSSLCFLIPASIILFLSLLVIYWWYPKHKSEETDEGVCMIVWREVVFVYLLVVLPGYPARDN
ncbi:hypothetical protein WR25_27202 [Diploscapter pachys]|uniref:Uncharacterized protein n=1 Tax=Diploscapter pachys TaxID=2018661 RepID=A0A2A2KW61_9BILA|nr:hypothetical protein WR25_27202 [Diploscapter pachys]